MEEMWAVSSGSYSDYRVVCVCPSKAEAQKVADKLRLSNGVGFSTYSDAEIESFPVLTAAAIAPVVVLRMSTVLWDDGSETDSREWTNSEWNFDGDAPAAVWRWVRAPAYRDKGGRLDVHGYDHEAVRRIFSDRRAMAIADPAFRSKPEASGKARTKVSP